MAKIKSLDQTSRRQIGKAIFDAWEAAIRANPAAPTIDRNALMTALNGALDLNDRGRSGKRIEYDLVFDTDLDANTRLVWLSIPTPETEATGGRDTWAKWKKDYYDDLSAADKAKKEEDLGTAVLFGCGR